MREGRFAGLVAGMAVVAIGLLAPSAAQAHPCATTWSLSTATFLSANDAGTTWAGGLPTPSANDSDCAAVEAALSTETAVSGADGPGLPPGANFNYTSNMTPLGHTLRVPPSPTALADINSDMAFKGNLAFQGHWSGFRVIDVSDPANPVQIYNTEACRHTSGQGDVIVHGNILVRTWDSPATGTQAGATCGGEAGQRPGRPDGLRGHPHLGHLQPGGAGLQAQAADGEPGQRRGRSDRLRRAHGDRSAGRCARQPLPLRRRLERQLPRHRHRAHQAVRPERRRVPAARRARTQRIVPRQQRAHERARRHGRLRDVRRRQRPCDVQVRHGQAGRRSGHAGEPGRRRESDADLGQADAGRDDESGGHDRSLGLVHLRRQAARVRPRAGRRHAGDVRGERQHPQQVAVLPRPRDRGDEGRAWCTRARRARTRELHVAQLQRRADVQGLLRRVRQLPVGHLCDRLHDARCAAGDRVRRSGAAGPDAARRAATGRRTSTTA